MTIQCCQCNKVRAGAEWTPPGFALDEAVSYTYCPICLSQCLTEIRAERARASQVKRARRFPDLMTHAAGA
jgi:hypothetical protein